MMTETDIATQKRNVPALRFPEFSGDWAFKKANELFYSSRTKAEEAIPIYSVTMDRGLIPRNSAEGKFQRDAAMEDNIVAFPNDIVYNMMRMWQGALGIAYQTCMISPAYVILRPKTGVDSEFYARLLKTQKYLHQLESYSYGITSDRLRLYFKDFSLIVLPKPPIAEQSKIAGFLRSIEHRIKLLDKKRHLLEQYRKGIMQQIFSQEIRFKDNNGEDFPDWEEKNLRELGHKFLNGGTPPTSIAKYWNGEIPWITGADFYNQEIANPRRFISLEAVKNSSTNIVKKGSLLIVTRTGVGKMAIAPYDVAISQDITGVDVKTDAILADYLIAYLDFKSRDLSSQNQGTSINGITRNDLLGMKVVLPSLPEQKKIASFLTAIDEKISATEKQLELTKAYKKGLVKQLFV